ncbi:MAG: pantoate--beta-alanine ligase [Anaerolineae bacterium]|nr:pantoate--beta-alanine ligase [Anaerolineae bacterium]
MRVTGSLSEFQELRQALNGRVGAVYTMGALHVGHLSLLSHAREENDAVVATLFVNPKQFARNEDLSRYPRTLESDLQKFERAGVDLVLTPSPEMMYPPGFQTRVDVKIVSQGLEGERRPDHFTGVVTVVAKLFNLTHPDRAYFGQKDAQQVVVIRQMARDLNFPVEIIVCPTVRETDGLAMSSRNVFLTPEQRQAAAVLYGALQAAGGAYDQGEHVPAHLIEAVQDVIAAEPLAEIDYIALNDPRTLSPIHQMTNLPVLLSLSVRFGATRLLDNCLLPLSLNNLIDLTRLLGV